MISRDFLYHLRRDLLSQAKGLEIQRAAILSQIADIEIELGIKETNNGRKTTSTGAAIEGSKLITENSQ